MAEQQQDSGAGVQTNDIVAGGTHTGVTDTPTGTTNQVVDPVTAQSIVEEVANPATPQAQVVEFRQQVTAVPATQGMTDTVAGGRYIVNGRTVDALGNEIKESAKSKK